MSHRGSEDDLRPVERAGEFGDADLVTDVQRPGPGASTIGAAEDAARGAGLDVIPERAHKHDVGRARVDEHRLDMPRGLETDRRPGRARINGLVDAVAPVECPAGDHVTGADVDDVRVRWSDLDCAHRGDFSDGVEDGEPDLSGARGLPETAAGKARVEDARAPDGAGDRADAAGAEGAEVAPGESGEETRIDCRAAAAGCRRSRRRSRGRLRQRGLGPREQTGRGKDGGAPPRGCGSHGRCQGERVRRVRLPTSSSAPDTATVRTGRARSATPSRSRP